MKDFSGFTITELLVVMSILTILLGLSVIAFNNYMVNYNVESQIKTLYSDLMGARLHAMNENRQYVVSFINPNSYVIAVDSDYDGTYNAGDIKIDKYSKGNLKYSFNWSPGGNNGFTIDERGRISVLNGHIRVNTPNSSEYDCISISNTRLKMGKFSGTNCEVR